METVRRGYEPKDEKEFGPKAAGKVTADAIILDKCGSWYNLNRGLIEQAVPNAWIFRLDGLFSTV